jgi:hypothetical protein
VIGLPFNDLRCMGSITEVVADLVEKRDELLTQLAAEHPTTDALAAWIRSLPQRDDVGDEDDGPKVDACAPVQRLRLPATDPNCVERAALYVAVAELLDPRPVRQLATLDTPIGLHTFPVENGAPIILDPRMPSSGLEIGLAMCGQGPIAVPPRNAIAWSLELAEEAAAPYRNGPTRVREARAGLMSLVDRGVVPDDRSADDIVWILNLAERAAAKWGPRVIAMVRSTALAIANLATEALQRARTRNLALEIEGYRFVAPPWLSGLARVATRVGIDVGAVALKTKLATMGISPDMIGLVEEELNREGLSLGPLAKPTKIKL